MRNSNNKRYYLTNAQFEQEIEELRSGERTIPQRLFCLKFLTRLEEGAKLARTENYPTREDGIDPHALGFALRFDVHKSGAYIAREIKIFQWVEFYTALDEDDVDTLESTVIDLLGLEKKWAQGDNT